MIYFGKEVICDAEGLFAWICVNGLCGLLRPVIRGHAAQFAHFAVSVPLWMPHAGLSTAAG